jgi:hypothetical protein
MDDLIWSARISATRRICVSPLSSPTVQENGAAENLGGDLGYFIYEIDEAHRASGISILGKAASEEAAMRLVDIFLASRRQPRRSALRQRRSA